MSKQQNLLQLQINTSLGLYLFLAKQPDTTISKKVAINFVRQSNCQAQKLKKYFKYFG